MIWNAREYKLELQGMQLPCIRFGTGKKHLVMIQGLNTRGIHGAALSLAYMYRLFAREYTVHLFDRRPDVPEGMTVREMAADVAMAMDALGITKADVLGVSQGGMIAQYLAIDRPDLVGKLVLAVTLSENNAVVCETLQNWIAWTQQGQYKRLVTDMAERMYSEAYLKRYRPFLPLLTLLQKPKDPQRFLRLTRACLTCAAYAELDRIQCPVLVLGGAQDKVVGGDASRRIAEKLGCELYLYEQLGHAAYEEAKDFNQRVLAFLRE